jgi:hypothetical protein
MSELLQSGQHPDADQLSAFAEHALPPHLQKQTLAHLAVCPNCRTIVALSLPPVEDLPEPPLQLVRKPWFRGWHLVLPAAAALTALVVIIHVHNAATIRSNTTPTQMAISEPPKSLSVPPTAPVVASKPSPPPAAKTQLHGATTAMGTAGRSNLQSNGALVDTQSLAKLPIEGRNSKDLTRQSAPTGGAAHGSLQASSSNGGSGVLGAAGQAPPQNFADNPVNRPQQNASNAAITSMDDKFTASAPMPQATLRQRPTAPATPSSASRDAAPVSTANQTVEVANASTPVATLSSSSDGLALKEEKSVFAQQPLPSHLPTLSVVSAAHQMVAIDTRNALFFSEDDGKHWKTVPPPWKGRAVKVDLVPSGANGEGYAIGKIGGLHATSNIALGGPLPSPAPAAPPPALNSSLTGTVADSSGAVIPDASVAVISLATKAVRTAKTDRTGHYLVDGLVPGSYQVEAQAPGFNKEQLAVTLAASQQSLENLTLSVGQSAETVTVEPSSMPSAAQSLARKKAEGRPVANPSVPVFEVTTNTGEHWTSTDGQTWKPK